MNPDSQEQERERILARYFNVISINGDNRQLVKRLLLGAVWSAILTPLLFYLRFGTINWFSISFTLFLVVLCLLFAAGFFFQTKTEYRTKVPLEGSLADRIDAWKALEDALLHLRFSEIVDAHSAEGRYLTCVCK